MKKDYDGNISAQNTPMLKQRRFCHITAMGWVVVNLIVFAILLPQLRAVGLGYVAVFAAHTVILFFDKRKTEWSWFMLVSEAIISLTVSVTIPLFFKLYFYFVVIGIELLISIAAYFLFSKIIIPPKRR